MAGSVLEAEDGTPGRYTDRALRLVALYFVDRMQRRNPRTIENDFRSFRHFARWRGTAGGGDFEWVDLTEATARAYLGHCISHSAEKGNHFSRVRAFYEWGVANGYADFDRTVLRVLKAIQAPGNAKGQAVRFRSPTHGPLTREEVRQITDALQRGAGSSEDRAVVMLHLEFGANPSAFGRLQNRDLLSYALPGATATGVQRIWQLEVPRVKKRNAAKREVKRRPLSPQLGELLDSLRRGAPGDRLLYWLNEADPEGSLRSVLRRFVEVVDLISPRTGQRLRLTPRRLRYTFATHLAEDGASPVHLAELLDHSDLQHVGVYTELTSRVADTVSRATDHVIAPLVNRFLGTVTDESTDTERYPIVPASAPHIAGLAGESATHDAPPILTGVGACRRDIVRDGLCERLPPLACYRCDRFAAFRTGPHATVLTGIEQAQRALAARGSGADRRLAVQLEEAREVVAALVRNLDVSANESGPRVTVVAAP